MDLLHVSPPAIEAIALSHAHGDHAGGLPALAARGVRAPVYALPGLPPEFLGEFARGKAGATHCTGEGAVARFGAAWGSDFVPLGVGGVVTVGAATAAAALPR